MRTLSHQVAQMPRWTSVLVGISLVCAALFLLLFSQNASNTWADETAGIPATDAHYVTIYDQDSKLTVRTTAATVAEVLERANITTNTADSIDPAPDTTINSDNFQINVHRARPVVVVDGKVKKYFMTASYDPQTIATEAGLTVYDGDAVTMETDAEDASFLEAGASNTYKLTRNGGRTLTVEAVIPFEEEKTKDFNLEEGQTRVEQVGEEGRKVYKYIVNFVDGVEVSRELISEEVIVQPVKRIVVEGAKPKHSAPVLSGTCVDWIRAAGVAESDIPAALELINHESGCRPNARNASSGAYGIPQSLPGNKMAAYGDDWETNPVTQIRWMANYVRKYGGWQGAMEFWWQHHWY